MSDPTGEALAEVAVRVPAGSRLRVKACAPSEMHRVRGQDVKVSIVGPDGVEVPVAHLGITAVTWWVDARGNYARAAVVFDGAEIDAEGDFDPRESKDLAYAHVLRRAEAAEEECRRLQAIVGGKRSAP